MTEEPRIELAQPDFDSHAQPGTARRGLRMGLLATSIPILILLDQWTKGLATDHLQGEPMQIFWGGLARLQYVQNKGAFLGAGDGLSPDVRFLLLTVGTALLLVGVGFVTIRRWDMPRLRFSALLLILAGGLGNLVDRFLYGYVVDFMNVGIGGFRTGIFNVADVLITTAVILLALEMFIGVGDDDSSPPQDPISSDSSAGDSR